MGQINELGESSKFLFSLVSQNSLLSTMDNGVKLTAEPVFLLVGGAVMLGTFKIAYKLLSCKLLTQPDTKQLLDNIILTFWEVDSVTLSGFVSQNKLCRVI